MRTIKEGTMRGWMRLVGIGMMLGAWAGSAVGAPKDIIGKPAPDFTLLDQRSEQHRLSEFRGKFVVLEWTNPECPFVRKHYDSRNMQGLQTKYTDQGVVWLSVDSAGPGNQGYVTGEQAAELIRQRRAAPTAFLLDPQGTVGRLYGAKATPHLFIVDPAGVLIYAGGIDDLPSTNPEDVKGAVNYVDQALTEARAGKPVSVPATQPYGCSVKYGGG